jgi:hypothetical protein
MKAKIEAWGKAENEGVDFIGAINPETYREIIKAIPSLKITPEKLEDIEKYLDMIEHTTNELKALKTGTEEAIKRLREISEGISL